MGHRAVIFFSQVVDFSGKLRSAVMLIFAFIGFMQDHIVSYDTMDEYKRLVMRIKQDNMLSSLALQIDPAAFASVDLTRNGLNS